MSSPVILITGTSSGLGRSLTLEALARGMRVIATARRLASIEDLAARGAKIMELDVNSSPETLKQYAIDAIATFGHIDILINNAGWVLGGAIEELSTTEMQAQFATNFFGVINVTNAFLPHFRSRKTGTIINISSVGAYFALEGGAIYCASKAAVDSISTAWSKELAPWNIRVTTVNLGAFRTSAATKAQRAKGNEIEGYNVAHAIIKGYEDQAGTELGDPSKGAKKLLDIIALDVPLPPFVALGEDAVHMVKVCLEARIATLEEWKEYGMGTNVEGKSFP